MPGHVQDRWYADRGGEKVPTARHGRGQRWRARWFDDNGKERSKSFARKIDADRHVAAMTADVARGDYLDPDAGRVTLRGYGDQWLAAQTSDPSTREGISMRLRVHVYPELGGYELRALRPSAVQAWLRGLQGKIADSYVRVVYAHLSAILSAAVDDGLIRRNPCRASSVKPPAADRRRIVPWTAGRVFAVQAALPGRFRAMVDAAAGLGLRQGEVFALAVEDVDWLRGVVHVRRQVKIVRGRLVFAPPKGGRERDVPMASVTGIRLSAHLQAFPAVETALPWREPAGQLARARLVFTTVTGKAIDRNHFNTGVWKPAVEAAGMTAGRDTGMHALRHFYASAQLEEGTSIAALAAYLGHHDPGFTLRTYTHLMPSSEGRARAAIDKIMTARENSDGPQTARSADG